MPYIARELERKFLKMNTVFKAVMVTGARQVGKSTMLKHLAEGENRTYVSMDDPRARELARSDAELFFQMYRPPVLIDEVQKAPELFEQIKILCDDSDERGRFWLTGSQSQKLRKLAGDSLAGRLGILTLYSFSQRELAGVTNVPDIDFSFVGLQNRAVRAPASDLPATYEHIWRGGMPDVQSLDEEALRSYFDSYVDTYLLRDAVDDNGVSNTEGFRKFLRACAAFNGQLLNYRDLAAAAGVSNVTAKEWVQILQSMGILYLMEPYYSNELSRLVKTPKLYFCDTGLCAYLSSWTTRDVLMNGAAAGHYYENYVVGELLRSLSYGTAGYNINYYRDRDMREIDIVLEKDGILHPLEIKKASHPDKRAIRSFRILERSGKEVGHGGIICMTDSPFPIDENNSYIPSWIL